MLLRTSVLCTLVILTLSCCAGLVNHDELSHSGHMSRVILIKDGDEDEKKYQQALERTGDNPGYLQLRRKPLVREDLDTNLIPTSDSERRRQNHGRRRHRTSSDTDRSDVNVLYDENDPDYRSAPSSSHHKKDTQKNDRTRKNKNEKAVSLVRRLPQAIIIGVKKGGTRALLEFLRMHPDVRAPGPEPHFFDRNYDKGLDWYRRQMPPTSSDQVTMEKTPSYFVTKGVPGRIFNMSKNVKFIVVVRDPVTRAISDYAQALAKRDNISSFEEMALEDNSTGLVATSWGAIRIGVYAKHLERWLQYFPLSKMHFVSGEKLITDPAGEMGKVQDFLGLDRAITDKNFLFNNTKGFPCLVRPDRVRRMPHCLSKTKGREHPKIDFKVLQRLRDFFRPFNQKFYQMVGYDFGWS